MNAQLLAACRRTSPVLAVVVGAMTVLAQDARPISLPPPNTTGGRPLMQVLKDRATGREFSSRALPLQTISDLCWAAFGINRATNDHRTAPSAMNSQEIELYLATPHGLFIYEAKPHGLKPVLAEDVRRKTGGQEFVKVAPLSLIFVADYARLTKAKPSEKDFYAAVDTGYVSQNVYLFCASEGLATVVHTLNGAEFAKTAGLRPEQKVLLAQAVGYPKK